MVVRRRGVSEAPRALAGVQQGSPLLAFKIEVEVLQWTDAPNSNSETRWQPGRRPTIDQEPGPIVETARRVPFWSVVAGARTHRDLADLATSAAPMNVVGDDPRLRYGLLVHP